MKLIFEKSKENRRGYSLPEVGVTEKKLEELIPNDFLRENLPDLPEVSELEVIRHYTKLSHFNHSVDTGFYPLGSCTMKYNPKVNEYLCSLKGFTGLHPYQPLEHVQGSMELMYELGEYLKEIVGLSYISLQPAAGSHGELTGMLMIRAYHNYNKNKKNIVIIPDSAHGTNPASAAMCGYKVITVRSNEKGQVDINALKSVLSDDIAAFMLTNPNTLGLFEERILEISDLIHDCGGLLYYDGANLNAIIGKVRPGDMGFDVVHLNLHKTFSTPHGGGGPGAGPVLVGDKLAQFLPVPIIEKKEDKYIFNYDLPNTIGKVKGFYGNFGVLIRAYCYILSMGKEGLKKVSENAVLNANYLKEKLKSFYHLPYDFPCMHEFVLSGKLQKQKGCSTLFIAKRLMDFGFHPPTVYFPLIVNEAMMIEPTESETKETLDEFVKALIKIAHEVEENPQIIQTAPHNTPVGKIDETKAARTLDLRWKK